MINFQKFYETVRVTKHYTYTYIHFPALQNLNVFRKKEKNLN